MNTQLKPSPSALRAADAVLQWNGTGYIPVTRIELAKLIETESGLAELLEAAKAAQRFFDVLREHYKDVFEFNSNDADGLLDWDVPIKIQDAIAKVSSPNADRLREILDALRGMIGLVQLIQAREPDLQTNHRFIEAMRVIDKAENPNADTKQAFPAGRWANKKGTP